MKNMRKPDMEVIRFNEVDVIAASSVVKTVSWSGLSDGNQANNYININGTDYVAASAMRDANTIKTALADYFEDSSLKSAGYSSILFGSKSLGDLCGVRNDSDSEGVYIYKGNLQFTKQ